MNRSAIWAAIFACTSSYSASAFGQQHTEPTTSQFSFVTLEQTAREAFIEREDGAASSVSTTFSRRGISSSTTIETVWTRVCYAPCTALLHRAAFYRVNDGSASMPFVLAPGAMRLTVHHGSPAGMYLGATSFILGLTAALSVAVAAPIVLASTGEHDWLLEGSVTGAAVAVTTAMIVGGWALWRGSMSSVRDVATGRRVARQRTAIQLGPRGIQF